MDKLEEITQTQTTRRTIVKTGVKLAYAAPLVAATFKLTARGASAAISAALNCPNVFICDFAEICGDGSCGCVPILDGGSICHQGQSCDVAACSHNSDCPSGTYCAQTCCPQPICVSPCGALVAAAGTGSLPTR